MSAVARKQSAILCDLIALAERVLEKPHCAFGHASKIEAMRAEIIVAQKSAGVIDDLHAMLCTALANIAAHGACDVRLHKRFEEMAETAIAFTRGDLARALDIEARGT